MQRIAPILLTNEDFTAWPHVVLDDRLAVWLDPVSDRVVFFDFLDDVGISLSRDEWRRALDWGGTLK